MNSSKGWGDAPSNRDAGDAENRSNSRRRPVPVLGAALAVSMLVIAIGLMAWRILPAGDATGLATGRVLIERSVSAASLSEQRLQSRAAEKALRPVYRRDGGNAAATLLLCASLSLAGDDDLDRPAQEEFEIQTLLNGLDPKACLTADLLLACRAFVTTGRLGEADWLVVETLQRNELRPRVLQQALEIRYELGREEEVLTHARELAELQPAAAAPWRWMAYVHEDRGYDEQLLEVYPKLIERAPEEASEFRLELIECHIRLGDVSAARREFDQLASDAPDALARSPLTRARMSYVEGDADDALRQAGLALEDNSENAEALLLEGRIFLARGEFAAAVTRLQHVLKLEPTNAETLYLLGQAHVHLGEQETATTLLARHQQVLDTRINIHRLERLAGRRPYDRELRLEIADLYGELGADEHADYWARAADSIMGE